VSQLESGESTKIMESVLTLVINLDRSVERLNKIGRILDLQGIQWERLPAVDGRALPAEQVKRFLDVKTFSRRHGMTPLPGELGCYLSHMHAFKRLLASPFSFALILEDDVLPLPGLKAVVSRLTALPRRWDMVKLSAVHSGTPVTSERLDECHQLAVMLSRCTGSSAYLVNRKAAQSYLDGLLPMSLPYDHEFDKAWRYGIKVRRVVPAVATHDMHVASTIASVPGAPSRKFHWTRRLTAHGYRVGNELKRLSHGLGQVIKERFST
jgi:glycosyl transferase, family 25